MNFKSGYHGKYQNVNSISNKKGKKKNPYREYIFSSIELKAVIRFQQGRETLSVSLSLSVPLVSLLSFLLSLCSSSFLTDRVTY